MNDRTKNSQIYHFTSHADWEKAQRDGEYGLDSLSREGFIHCSQHHQVAKVASAIAKGRRDLVLLVIDESKLQHPVVYENCEQGVELFPHVYGPIDLEAVIEVQEFQPNEGGMFEPPNA